VPYGFDQPDNGRRLVRLGAGTVIPVRRVTGERLAVELGALIDSRQVHAACARYRAWVGATDAVGAACDTLEEVGQY
jgi:UDP:flavonoid glycosyltransferase YjiC (YdhE family)